MIEETAQVVKADKNRIWVASTQTSGCSGCMQKTACGTQAIAIALKKKAVAVEVDSTLSLCVGDVVTVAIDEKLLLLVSLVMYVFPLIALLGGGGIVDWLVPDDNSAADVWIAAGALLSLLLSLWAIHRGQRLFLFGLYARPLVVKKR